MNPSRKTRPSRNAFPHRKTVGLGLTALTALGLAAGRPAAAQVTITNPSFETDPQGNYQPVTGWDAATDGQGGGFGTDADGGYFANNGTIPDGAEVAFIQASSDDAMLSQDLSGFKAGDQYVVTFYDNERVYSGSATLVVTLGGKTIVPATVVTPVGNSNPYNFVTADSFTATDATAMLTFENYQTVDDDTTILLDDVSIRDIGAAPEPSQYAVLVLGALGLAGLGLNARRRKPQAF